MAVASERESGGLAGGLAATRRARYPLRPVPTWTPSILLFVFATHLPFFLYRYRRTGEIRFAATSLTFALLTAAYGLRVFAPEAAMGGVSLHRWVQVPAWLAAAVSIGLLVRHAFARRRAG